MLINNPKVDSFLKFSVMLVMVSLVACSANQQLDKMSQNTSDMNKKMSNMNKSVSTMVSNSKDQSSEFKSMSSEIKSLNKTMTDLSDKQKKSDMTVVDDSKNSQLATLETLRFEKKQSREHDLAALKATSTEPELYQAANDYICDFEFRLWKPSMADQISLDELRAFALKDYLVRVSAHLLNSKDNFDINVFAESKEPAAELNFLIQLLNSTDCSGQVKEQNNPISFYSMIKTAFMHEKSLNSLTLTDEVALGDLKPAALLAVQIYHNLQMKNALKIAMRISRYTDNGLNYIATKYLSSNWELNLEKSTAQEIRRIHLFAIEAITVKNNLKSLGIEPIYDSNLQRLIEKMQVNENKENKTSIEILNLFKKQYLDIQ
jgi:hypothetical protein